MIHQIIIRKDSTSNAIIRMTAQNPYYPTIWRHYSKEFSKNRGRHQNSNIKWRMRIFHPLPVGLGEGWWGVVNKIANIMMINTDLDLILQIYIAFNVHNVQI